MRKVLVIYKSKTGFTERYAQWIAEDLGVEAVPLNKVSLEILSGYDLLIFGGPLFASRISGLDKLRTWMEKLPKKIWVVFATGATPSDKDFVKSIERINFSQSPQKPARFYYFLSGMDFKKMGWFNRTLIRLFARMSQKKVKQESKNTPLPPSEFKSFDLSNRVYIEPLLQYVKLKI